MGDGGWKWKDGGEQVGMTCCCQGRVAGSAAAAAWCHWEHKPSHVAGTDSGHFTKHTPHVACTPCCGQPCSFEQASLGVDGHRQALCPQSITLARKLRMSRHTLHAWPALACCGRPRRLGKAAQESWGGVAVAVAANRTGAVCQMVTAGRGRRRRMGRRRHTAHGAFHFFILFCTFMSNV